MGQTFSHSQLSIVYFESHKPVITKRLGKASLTTLVMPFLASFLMTSFQARGGFSHALFAHVIIDFLWIV
jgi:hypothetical protein